MMKAIRRMAGGKSSKLFIPYEASGLPAGLGSIADVLKSGSEKEKQTRPHQGREEDGTA